MLSSSMLYIVKMYKNPKVIFQIARRTFALKKRYSIEKKYHNKLAFVDGKYFVNCNNAGWPSKHFYRLVELESRKTIFHDITNFENIRMVQMAFTKKCPLNCEHCYEGDELNKKDVLSVEDKIEIVRKLQNAGIPMIHFGGGDPMAKINDLIDILDSAKSSSDFWVFTSGFNLNNDNAQRLKNAGLTGVSIGLDHYLKELHNKFRRNDKAFDWATEGAKAAVNANLVLTFTICLTRDFCTEENLIKYMELAKSYNASFVQFLDPRAVGNYANKEVHLSSEQIQIAEKIFVEMNSSAEYNDMPIVLYPGYHQRRTGCTAAGVKYLYIDTNGNMSSCPFCRNTKAHILNKNQDEQIQEMINEGCGLPEEFILEKELLEQD